MHAEALTTDLFAELEDHSFGPEDVGALQEGRASTSRCVGSILFSWHSAARELGIER